MAMSWAISAPTKKEEGGTPGSKRSRTEGGSGSVKKEDDEAPRGILKDVANLCLRNTRALAHVEAILYETWKNPEGEVTVAGAAAGKGYAERTKGVRGHKEGSPHVHVVIAVLTAIGGMKEVPAEVTLAINEVLTICTDPAATEKIIPVYFLSKMHEDNQYRMVWHDMSEGKKVSRILRWYLVKTASKQMEGTAPRNPAERRIKKWLETKK
jgi:hypothetical protein